MNMQKIVSSWILFVLVSTLAGGIGGWGAVHEEIPFISYAEQIEAFIIGMTWGLVVSSVLSLRCIDSFKPTEIIIRAGKIGPIDLQKSTKSLPIARVA